MKRTAHRPLPAGRISAVHAAMWALASGGTGVAILYYKVGKESWMHGAPAILALCDVTLYTGTFQLMSSVTFHTHAYLHVANHDWRQITAWIL